MQADWKRRFTWIEHEEIAEAFHKEPFPARGHRGDLGALSLSIARFGIINPIVARVRMGKLQVICGYRRWLAAQVARAPAVPVIVGNLTDEEAVALFHEEEAFQRLAAEPTAARASRPVMEPPEREALSRAVRASVEAPAGPTERRLATLHARLSTCYARARADQRLVEGEIEALANELKALDPIRRGMDLRDIGAGVEIAAGSAAGEAGCAQLATHALRATILAQHFAQQSGWSDDGARRLGMAALVHDVGMLFLPTDWYTSPYPLPRSRKDAIQRHTVLGQELILRSGQALSDLAQVARDHHERWDGTGYPDGKKGREVALAGRLAGLIDAYVAMVSERPYRRAYLLREALGLLANAARVGIYEPALVRQFELILSSCPIGLCGRLADGGVVRVRQVESQQRKSHLVEFVQPSSEAPIGERFWWREEDLRRRVKEIAPPLPAAALEVEPVVQASAT